ncbi:MAG: quinolinate synthase [Prosthecochloris sp.]|uniref:quinolinate synthase NadA n=1 Tax=Prosthecochloris sp. TaxID=290513 RepID=UPI0013CB5346|nr:quinolinate synthase NadA [Prosthecochloris sp.]NEX12139.1 quinolinate synthase [Prosthecochloris sp.]
MTALQPYTIPSQDDRQSVLADKIKRLREERNAIILAHYYTVPEIQQVADVVGDSLALARAAETTDADVIVFAGVYFMGETAKILNPGKTVLMPDNSAGCPLADSCPADRFRSFREQYPDALVISYINSTAEIKAESDIICTSSNAVDIVSQIPADKRIIFGPDRNLGSYVMQQLEREMILWQGFCYVHESYSWDVIETAVRQFPDAQLIAHPECRREVLDHADFVGSTGALLAYSQKSPADAFIVATEPGILYEMKKRSPEKSFIAAPKDIVSSQSVCSQMKQNTMENLCNCLETMAPQIVVDETLAAGALKSIRKMLEMSK